MTLVFESGSLNVGEQRTHTLANRIRGAGVAMQNYQLGYDREEIPVPPPDDLEGDHHVLSMRAGVSIVGISNEQVTVKVEGEIRDSSGNRGGGAITYLLVADTD